MTPFDFAVAGLVLIGALWGMLRGALRQIASVIAWVACFAVPWKVAGPVSHFLEKPLSAPFPIVYVFTVFGLALLVQIVVRLLFMALRTAWLKRRPAEKTKGPPPVSNADIRRGLDRAAGTLLGAAKMAALLWIGLSLLALADGPLEMRGVELGVKGAGFVQLSTQYNAIALLFGSEIHRLDTALRRMQAARKAPGKHHAGLETLAGDARWDSIARDDSLVRALYSGDLRALKRSPVLSLLTDPHALDRAVSASSGP